MRGRKLMERKLDKLSIISLVLTVLGSLISTIGIWLKGVDNSVSRVLGILAIMLFSISLIITLKKFRIFKVWLIQIFNWIITNKKCFTT